MKKQLMRTLAFALILCMVLPITAVAAETTWIKVTIEDDHGEYSVVDESSHYLTENTNLLAEVVAIINENYLVNRKLFGFGSPAMRDIMDVGLKAYAESDAAWETYVDTYYQDVNPVAGDVSLKGILRNKSSVLGDLQPNVEHKISFKNEVAGDPKYGYTYIVTVVRYGNGAAAGVEKPGVDPSVGTNAALNKEDHIAYINGYPGNIVKPNANITREEAATIFYRLMTEESRAAYETTDCSFPDVEADRWSRTAIATMANAGVITGYPDGSFGPQKNVTRAEFAVIAARFDDISYGGADLFPDIAGHWAADEINQAASKGWVKGDEDGCYRPDDPITRAEAVTLINRVLERLPESEEDLLDGMLTFIDNADVDAWYYLAIQEAANGHDFVRKDDGVHETWTALK